MKNKKTAWILLPAVLSIWGFLGWKFYMAMNDSAPLKVSDNTLVVPEEDQVVPDTYQLLLDYPDPFLATSKPTPKKSSSINSQTPKQVIPKTEPVAAVWPEIRYAGLVKSPKDGKMVGFLSVNGTSHFVKNQDVIGELQVLKIWNDSAKVGFGKEMRVIRK